jgi:hypothetical protein
MADISLLPVVYDSSSSYSSTIRNFKSRMFSFGSNSSGDLISNVSASQQDLINKFFLILFTKKGDLPTSTNTGTGFRDLLSNYDPSTVYEDIALCLLDAESQVKASQAGRGTSTNTAILLNKIDLIGIDAGTPGQLRVQVNLVLRSGRTIAIELPTGV